MKFKLKVKNADGLVREIEREAADKFTLYHELKKEGETVILTEEVHKDILHDFVFGKADTSAPGGFSVKIPFLSGVNTQEKILFAKNLSSMLLAGLPLSRALSVMERQTKNAELKKIIVGIDGDIKKGTTLSAAMKKYPKVFSQLFVSMVSAGEESGKLASSLEIVGSQMEKTFLLQGKIKGAMIYPAVIFSAMILVGVLMMIYVVPTLTSTFEALHVELPASTQFIIALSDILKNDGLYIVFGLIVLIFGIYTSSKSPSGRRFIDWTVLHIPVISPLVKETNSARTARTFSSLISSGVSVVDALSITSDVIQNSYYRAVIAKAKQKIQIGEPIADVFTGAEDLYPPFVGEMIAVGEETGELSTMLLKVASYYENEVEQKTKDMSTIIEPVLMVIIGIVVGFFAISMITPTYSLVGTL